MEILTLIIKQKFFDEIVSGKKKQEFRDCKPTTEARYLEMDEEGYAVFDDEGRNVMRHYDAIRFYVGYKKDRDTALVEVKGARCDDVLDDDGNPVEYVIYNGQYFDMKMLRAMRLTDFPEGTLTKADKAVKQLADNMFLENGEENEEWISRSGLDFWTPGIVTYDLGEILEVGKK